VNQFFGILNPNNNGTITNGDNNVTTDSNNAAGCTFSQSWSSNVTNTADFLGVPLTDVLWRFLNNGLPGGYFVGRYIDLGTPTTPRHGHECGRTTPPPEPHGSAVPAVLPRNGSTLSSGVIYSLGLVTPAYPLSPDLLLRVSNDPSSTSTIPTIRWSLCTTPAAADIDAAFTKIASEILRIASK